MVTSGNDPFPTLLSCAKAELPSAKLGIDETLFDVKFYPHPTPNGAQIFAFTGVTDTFVCRLRPDSDPPFETLRVFRDAAEYDNKTQAQFNSIAWSQDPVTGDPWLCIAGHFPTHIKVLDVQTGDVVRTLSGHGRGVNDLAISPLSPSLLASGAEDSTIRLWHLGSKYRKQPCVALFGGEGHKAPILAIHFHPNGKWLLSGGIDTAVCLWAIPGLEQLGRGNDERRGDEPLVVYYPHFFTKELHPNYVDCFAFYGDLILSKAARDQESGGRMQPQNEILLWEIEGFDSDANPAEDPPIPEPARQTRSSFPHDHTRRGFRRLLTFGIPHTDRFYHRFGFLHVPNARPILCMGDQKSRYLFWDFQRLEDGECAGARPFPKPKKKQPRPKKGADALGTLRRSESTSRDTVHQTPETSSTTGPDGRDTTALSERFVPLEPHYRVTAKTKLSERSHFATSQIAWSPDATTMITVGDHGMVCVFKREKNS